MKKSKVRAPRFACDIDARYRDYVNYRISQVLKEDGTAITYKTFFEQLLDAETNKDDRWLKEQEERRVKAALTNRFVVKPCGDGTYSVEIADPQIKEDILTILGISQKDEDK